MIKNKNRKERCYSAGEALGSVSKLFVAGAIVTFFAGAIVELVWDATERKENKKRLNN